MGYCYAVIGAGRQGTAAAYDLARFGDVDYLGRADGDICVGRLEILVGPERRMLKRQ